eukprot:Unigene5001_Nuclearia_a/m.15324 Unigene5001_Nuclearia_a/g.15324  ORF Unigene5001_Nuclearia_a/g.15324 Unigene5001_Nuclearia_a/m.15324 type:complete len:580 (+) Unigene5001_Nuclearia_a:817-2556(+)
MRGVDLVRVGHEDVVCVRVQVGPEDCPLPPDLAQREAVEVLAHDAHVRRQERGREPKQVLERVGHGHDQLPVEVARQQQSLALEVEQEQVRVLVARLEQNVDRRPRRHARLVARPERPGRRKATVLGRRDQVGPRLERVPEHRRQARFGPARARPRRRLDVAWHDARPTRARQVHQPRAQLLHVLGAPQRPLGLRQVHGQLECRLVQARQVRRGRRGRRRAHQVRAKVAAAHARRVPAQQHRQVLVQHAVVERGLERARRVRAVVGDRGRARRRRRVHLDVGRVVVGARAQRLDRLERDRARHGPEQALHEVAADDVAAAGEVQPAEHGPVKDGLARVDRRKEAGGDGDGGPAAQEMRAKLPTQVDVERELVLVQVGLDRVHALPHERAHGRGAGRAQVELRGRVLREREATRDCLGAVKVGERVDDGARGLGLERVDVVDADEARARQRSVALAERARGPVLVRERTVVVGVEHHGRAVGDREQVGQVLELALVRVGLVPIEQRVLPAPPQPERAQGRAHSARQHGVAAARRQPPADLAQLKLGIERDDCPPRHRVAAAARDRLDLERRARRAHDDPV